MIDRRYFDRLYDAEVEVKRSQGNRGPDGWTETEESTVLLCKGNLQSQGRELRERAAYFDAGDVMAYCSKSVAAVRPSDTVIIRQGSHTIEGVVEQVMTDDASLLISR